MDNDFLNDLVSTKNLESNLVTNELKFNSIKSEIEKELKNDLGRPVPTMVHLPSKVRKDLEMLVLSLQNKYKKRITISQVASMIIEKTLQK